jgi:hypothetical protein
MPSLIASAWWHALVLALPGLGVWGCAKRMAAMWRAW